MWGERMSYCVNCGVELERSLKECPLCNTPIMNPREMKRSTAESPFPTEKGEVESEGIKRKDLGILISVVLIATGVICGMLNILVFQGSPWSFLVIGACVMLWVLCIPAVIYTRLSPYAALLLDGLSIAFYLFLITFVTGSDEWFWNLALPIVALVTIVIEAFICCLRKLPVTFLTTTLYFFTAIAILCLGLELMIDWFISQEIHLVWSAVVLTVCAILDATLITLLSRSRLRNAVRKRLHF